MDQEKDLARLMLEVIGEVMTGIIMVLVENIFVEEVEVFGEEGGVFVVEVEIFVEDEFKTTIPNKTWRPQLVTLSP